MQPGYYQLTKPLKDFEGEVGDIFYLVGVTGDSVEIIQYDTTWHMNADQFEDAFEFDPNGIEHRQKQLSHAMGGLHEVGSRQDQLMITASAVPCLPAPGDESSAQPELVDAEEDAPVSQERGLTLANGMTAAQVGQGLKVVKTQLAFTKRAIARRQKELMLLIKEQELILRAKTQALTKQVEMAMEAIYMINAYLGKDEELVRIRRGQPAPADTKVVIRQLVLFMDEESAAADEWAERGGMDFTNVKEFDDWVKDPRHLDIILPEQKGIVAIKPRRNDKSYSDNAFVNAELNRKNKCLYLLIRNGEILYRIYTTLWLQDVLFPRRDEFDEFFYKRDWDWERKSKRVRPGSRDYMEAMERAAKHHRRFYTVLLLIQGIIDRTKVLNPMPEERVNICDLSESTKYFTFLKDAEDLLGDGRPRFKAWLSGINQAVEVGCRVVGNWSRGWSYSAYESRGDRISPRTARDPAHNAIHTIEKEMGEGELAFFYSRSGDTTYHGWRDWQGHDAVRRARYNLKRSDLFFIHFDAASVEDLQYYLSSRLHRHEYQEMLPLMALAIKMKHEEEKTEAPFRKLLVGQIVKGNSCSFEAAEARVGELVHWWKFKNKTHRALTADDSKAIRMIVAEFGRRDQLEKQQAELSGLQKQVIEVITGDDPNTLAVFHRKDNEYVSYSWHNDQNVFVREQHWELSDELELDCSFDKSWKTVDKRHDSWQTIWSHERWAEWRIGASASEHLTDDELANAIKWGVSQIKGLKHYSSRKGAKKWMQPLAVMRNDDDEITIWYVGTHAIIPVEKFMTGEKEPPSVGRFRVKWEKKATGISFRVSEHNTISICLERAWTNKPKKRDPFAHDHRPEGVVVKMFDDVREAAVAEDAQIDAVEKRRNKLLKPVRRIEQQINDAIIAAWYEKEHAKFLEEYTDPDGSIWEDYKSEDLKQPDRLWPGWVDNAASYLIESGIEFDGLTVEQFLQMAKKHGYKWDREDTYEWHDAIKDIVLNLKYEPEDKERYRYYNDDDEDDNKDEEGDGIESESEEIDEFDLE